jgi:hypothetical protein
VAPPPGWAANLGGAPPPHSGVLPVSKINGPVKRNLNAP